MSERNPLDRTIAQWMRLVGTSYTSSWRAIRADVMLKEVDDLHRIYTGLLTNTATGVAIPLTQHTGSFYRGGCDGHPSCRELCETFVTTAEYIFNDGTPLHGLTPFEEWCASANYNPESPLSHTVYTDWLMEAVLAATLMDDALRDAVLNEEEVVASR